jgi:hypothetical protein
MFKFNKSFAAVAMAVASFAAFAQETNKSDFFNQEPPATSATPNESNAAIPAGLDSGTAARKIRITNSQVAELGAGAMRAGTAAGDRAGTSASVADSATQRLQNGALQWKMQNGSDKEPSEFQKFIADNTG